MRSLKEQIRNTSKGGILELKYSLEFREQLLIKRPITIRSVSSPATIVESSPTITIQSKNVIIENLNIVSNDEKGVGLSVKKGCKPVLTNVFIKGKVEGLDGEEGDWEIPDVLELAPIVPNKKNRKKIIIRCPVPAKIYPAEISVTHCHPEDLAAGLNEVEITIDEISENTLLTGYLIIETVSHQLKRKISLAGNTLNLKSYDGDQAGRYILWICPSARIPVNADILRNLPEGTQSEPYGFVLDESRLKSEGYDIRIEGLPEGLFFNNAISPPRIEGIPKHFGESRIKFRFKKGNLNYKYLSKLIINEKVIVPLKITPVQDPVSLIEDEMVSIKFDIVSSNSPNVMFESQKDLPEGLYLNESAGEIYGRISEHGRYFSIIRIEDGINELLQPLRFHVKPKHPLKLNIGESCQVYKGKKFNVPIIIEDSARLSPGIMLAGSHSDTLSVESAEGNIFLSGKFTEVKDYHVGIIVEDTYKRSIRKTLLIRCVDNPGYTFQWIPDSPICVKGRRHSRFSEAIKAVVNEDHKLKLKYSCVGNLPAGFFMGEDGWFSGKIDGMSHSLIIRAEAGEWHTEKTFEIITSPDSSNIVSCKELPPIFGDYKKDRDHDEYAKIEIKKELRSGRVYENYSERLLMEDSHIPENLSLEVNHLPEGLAYNPDLFTIEGLPAKAGIYSLEISDPVNQSAVTAILEIKSSPYHDTRESSDEKKKKRRSGVKLGKAFQ
ncbi:hypothetical protein QUF80_10910 [Desulfococcaceae bacterium HSG8]|nr:hypothetical protein [Desulfococcaceae bacterium HSG8]